MRLRFALLVVLLAVVLYSNTLNGEFVIDDRAQILHNPLLPDPAGLKKIFTTNVWAFYEQQASTPYYRPLMNSTRWFIWRVSGPDPAGYHAVNIVLNALVCLLVLMLIAAQPVPNKAQQASVAVVAAVLFATHPIHTEAVAWISALPDLQCATFVLLGWWLQSRYAGASGRRRWLVDAAIFACVLLALLAKEIGIVLPILLVLDAWRRSELRASLLRIGACGAAIAMYLLLRMNALGALLSPSGGEMRPLLWLALLWEYTWRLFWPVRLSAFRTVPVPAGVTDIRVLAGAVILAGLAALTLVLYRRNRPEWLAPPLFLFALAPTFLAPIRGEGFWLGERYLYLPSVAFCWLGASALCSIRRLPHKVLQAVLIAIAIAFAAMTVVRNGHWRSELGFYEHELRQQGEAPEVRPLLVEAYLRRNMPDSALEHAEAMVRISPDDPRSHNALAFVYVNLGDRERAIQRYEHAVEVARRRGQNAFAARALNNLAVAHSQAGQRELALRELREATQLDPRFVDGHLNLALALMDTGDRAGARESLQRALAIDPANSAARQALARLEQTP